MPFIPSYNDLFRQRSKNLPPSTLTNNINQQILNDSNRRRYSGANKRIKVKGFFSPGEVSTTSSYLDGISVAYSLRDLFVTGQNVIEVQSSSSFSNTDPNNTRSFTADEITNGTLVSYCNEKGYDGFVRKIYDHKNENNSIAYTPGISWCPRIVKNGALITNPINGLPAIEVGSNDLHTLNWSDSAIAADGQFSVFNVMQNNSGTNITESTYLRIRSQFSDGGIIDTRVMNEIQIGESNNQLLYFAGDSLDSYSTEQNSIVISSHIFNNEQFDEQNNGTAKLYINGVLEDTRGFTRNLNHDFDNEGSTIFGSTHSTLNNVFFQEFLFYPSDKTNSRELIESNLSIYSA